MSETAVVVPGSHLQSTRGRLVRRAERIACDLVVFSGRDEALDMRDQWRGADVDLVVEEAATSTAENAAFTLPLLLARGVNEAVVVCTPAHLMRARWIFRRIFGAAGIRTSFRIARVAPTPGAVVWEIAAATVARRQVRDLQ